MDFRVWYERAAVGLDGNWRRDGLGGGFRRDFGVRGGWSLGFCGSFVRGLFGFLRNKANFL